MKEEELIEQMKNGNNIAFAALYDYYCQKVYNFTKLYVTSSDTVAERAGCFCEILGSTPLIG